MGVGAVHQWGLFPASALSTPVRLSAPAKVLFVGANALLTMTFRGGTTRGSTFSPFSSALSEGDTPGPAPKTDVKLGPSGSGFVTAHKTQAHVQVIKGDTQKADSAAVPDHLWVHAFL